MGSYTVTDAASLIGRFGETTKILNTGAKPCWIKDDSGIKEYGFPLLPGASYDWPPGRDCYATCDSGNITTVNAGNSAGGLYSPSPLNQPNLLWAAYYVGCNPALGAPGTNGNNPGNGPNQFSGTSNADTGFIDVSGYSTVYLNVLELGVSDAALNYYTRRITLYWYIEDGTGFTLVNKQNFKPFCDAASLGLNQPIVPNLKLVTPTYGTHLVAVVGVAAPAMAGPDAGTYSLRIMGDNRVIGSPVWSLSASAYYVTETLTINNVDMCDDVSYSGFTGLSVAAGGTTTVRTSSQHGPHLFNGRVSTAAALVATTRVQLVSQVSGKIISGLTFAQGLIGIQYNQAMVNMPTEPCRFECVNNQGAASTFAANLTPAY